VLPTGLPNKLVAVGARYGSFPSQLQQQITFALGRDAQGNLTNAQTYPWAQLNNRQVTLSFKPATQADDDALRALLPMGEITDFSQLPASIPAYLVRVVPELKVEGTTVLSGSTMNLGDELDFVFDPRFSGRAEYSRSYSVIAGSYLTVSVVGGAVSSAALEDIRERIRHTAETAVLAGNDAADSLSKESLFGDMFQAGLLSYYSNLESIAFVAGLQLDSYFSLAAGLGSFGNEPSVDRTFGVARSLQEGLAILNLPMIQVTGSDSTLGQAKVDYALRIGAMSSALESVIPEQMFSRENYSSDAISATGALVLASTQGQHVFRLTQSNMSQVLPLLSLPPNVSAEVQAALAAGKEVVTHPRSVSIEGWTGFGYVIEDKITGDAAYKIGTGNNGGAAKIGGLLDRLALSAVIVGPQAYKFFLGLLDKLLLPLAFAGLIMDMAEVLYKCWYSAHAFTVIMLVFMLFMLPFFFAGPASIAATIALQVVLDGLFGWIRDMAVNEYC
jgi:hypothetical protein